MSGLAEERRSTASITVPLRLVGEAVRSPRSYQITLRLTFVIALTTLAFFIPITDTIAAITNGSRTAYVITTPVLVAMIITGYRHPPRGVGDAESDWILATLLGLGGLAALELIIRRLPTVAAQWHLPNVQMVVWLITSSMVVFTVRHVARLWTAWLYAFLCALVMPYLLVLSGFGGSDTAAAVLAVVLATIATFMATRFSRLFWRVAGTMSSLCFGIAWVMVLSDSSLLVRVLVGACATPVLSVFALNRFSHRVKSRRFPAVTAKFPKRHAWSYLVVAAMSVMVLAVQWPRQLLPTPPEASPDWPRHANLTAFEDFPFISRFIGPGTSMTRYLVPAREGMPNAAIDVISGANLAALRDFRDAIWYPHSEPVNYVKKVIDGPMTVQGRSVHNNGSAAGNHQSGTWYAVTWGWHTGDVYQRVMVVVNQETASNEYPPEPGPIGFDSTFLLPLEWILRQQPDPIGSVDQTVVDYAESLAHELLRAGARRD